MYIVNAGPGFKKMLWPAAQKFLDVKTISKIQVKDIVQPVASSFPFSCSLDFCINCIKIQVLEPKSLSKLLEVIDSRYVYIILSAMFSLALDSTHHLIVKHLLSVSCQISWADHVHVLLKEAALSLIKVHGMT